MTSEKSYGERKCMSHFGENQKRSKQENKWIKGERRMIKGLIKGIAYTAGFIVLGGIGVSIVAAIEHADYDVE